MSSLPWLRLYKDVIDNPKTGNLKDSEFRLFIEILCVVSENNDGISKEFISWRLRKSITKPIRELIKRGLIIEDTDINGNTVFFVNGWEKRQFPSDSSSERTRRYRNRIKKCDGYETSQERHKERDSDATDKNRTEQNRTEESNTSLEPKNPGSPLAKIFITIPLVGDKEFPVTEEMMDEFKNCYPGIDVGEEIRKIRGWNFSNPKNRKTKSGIVRHINSWLSKSQNSSKPSSQNFQPRILNNVQHNQLLLEEINREEDQKRLNGDFNLIEEKKLDDYFR